MRDAIFFLLLSFSLSFPSSALAQAELEGAVGALVDEGAIDATEREPVMQQLRQRLGDGERFCQGETESACLTELRERTRNCVRVGREKGLLMGGGDATELAAGMLMLSHELGSEKAGELVTRQLEQRWQTRQISGAAEQASRMKSRWRAQAMRLLGECTLDASCSADAAHQAMQQMHRDSRRADADARHTRRQLHRAMRQGLAGPGMQHRFRRGQGEGDGQGRRHRYRHQMEGEGRRGGHYGGNASGGPGQGWGKGRK